MRIGYKIKKSRLAVGLTLEALADCLGYDVDTVREIQDGECIFPMADIEKFAQALQIEPQELLGIDKSENEPSQRKATKEELELHSKKFQEKYMVIDAITEVFGSETSYCFEKFLLLPEDLQEEVFVFVNLLYSKYAEFSGQAPMPEYKEYKEHNG